MSGFFTPNQLRSQESQPPTQFFTPPPFNPIDGSTTKNSSTQPFHPTTSFRRSLSNIISPQPGIQHPNNSLKNPITTLLNQNGRKYRQYNYPINQQSRQEYQRFMVLSNPIIEVDPKAYHQAHSSNNGTKPTSQQQFTRLIQRNLGSISDRMSIESDDTREENDNLQQPLVTFGPNHQPNLDHFYQLRNVIHDDLSSDSTNTHISDTHQPPLTQSNNNNIKPFPFGDPNGFYIQSQQDQLDQYPFMTSGETIQLSQQQVIVFARDLAVYEQLHSFCIPFSGIDVGPDGIAIGANQDDFIDEIDVNAIDKEDLDDYNSNINMNDDNPLSSQSPSKFHQKHHRYQCPTSHLFNLLRVPSISLDSSNELSTTPFTTLNESPTQGANHHQSYSLTLHQHDAMFGGCYCGIVVLVFRDIWARDMSPVWVYPSHHQSISNQQQLEQKNQPKPPPPPRLCIPSLLKKGDIFHATGVKFKSINSTIFPTQLVNGNPNMSKSAPIKDSQSMLSSPPPQSPSTQLTTPNNMNNFTVDSIYLSNTTIPTDSTIHQAYRMHPDVLYHSITTNPFFSSNSTQPSSSNKSNILSSQSIPPIDPAKKIDLASIVKGVEENQTVFDCNFIPTFSSLTTSLHIDTNNEDSINSLHSPSVYDTTMSQFTQVDINKRLAFIRQTLNSLFEYGQESYHNYLFLIQWVTIYWKNTVNLLQLINNVYSNSNGDDNLVTIKHTFPTSLLSLLPQPPPLLIIDKSSFVILHPHVTLMATALSKAQNCIRQATLATLFPKSQNYQDGTLNSTALSFSQRVVTTHDSNLDKDDNMTTNNDVEDGGDPFGSDISTPPPSSHLHHPAISTLISQLIEQLPRSFYLDNVYQALADSHRMYLPQWKKDENQMNVDVKKGTLLERLQPSAPITHYKPQLNPEDPHTIWDQLHRYLLWVKSRDNPSEFVNDGATRERESKSVELLFETMIDHIVSNYLSVILRFLNSTSIDISLENDIYDKNNIDGVIGVKKILKEYIAIHYITPFNFINHLLSRSIKPSNLTSNTNNDHSYVSNINSNHNDQKKPAEFNLPSKVSWAMHRGNILHALVQTALLHQNVSLVSLVSTMNTVLHDNIAGLVALVNTEGVQVGEMVKFLTHIIKQQHNLSLIQHHKRLQDQQSVMLNNGNKNKDTHKRNGLYQYHPKLEYIFIASLHSSLSSLIKSHDTSQCQYPTTLVEQNLSNQSMSDNEIDIELLRSLKSSLIPIQQLLKNTPLFNKTPSTLNRGISLSRDLSTSYHVNNIQRYKTNLVSQSSHMGMCFDDGNNNNNNNYQYNSNNPDNSTLFSGGDIKLTQRSIIGGARYTSFSTLYEEITKCVLPAIHLWGISHSYNVFNKTFIGPQKGWIDLCDNESKKEQKSSTLKNNLSQTNSTLLTHTPTQHLSVTSQSNSEHLEISSLILNRNEDHIKQNKQAHELFTTLQSLSRATSPFSINHYTSLEQPLFSIFLGLRGRVDALVDTTQYDRVPIDKEISADDNTAQTPSNSTTTKQSYPSKVSTPQSSQVLKSTTSRSCAPQEVVNPVYQKNLIKVQPLDSAISDDVVDLRYRQLVPIEIKSSKVASMGHRLQAMVYSMITHHLSAVPTPFVGTEDFDLETIQQGIKLGDNIVQFTTPSQQNVTTKVVSATINLYKLPSIAALGSNKPMTGRASSLYNRSSINKNIDDTQSLSTNHTLSQNTTQPILTNLHNNDSITEDKHNKDDTKPKFDSFYDLFTPNSFNQEFILNMQSNQSSSTASIAKPIKLNDSEKFINKKSFVWTLHNNPIGSHWENNHTSIITLLNDINLSTQQSIQNQAVLYTKQHNDNGVMSLLGCVTGGSLCNDKHQNTPSQVKRNNFLKEYLNPSILLDDRISLDLYTTLSSSSSLLHIIDDVKKNSEKDGDVEIINTLASKRQSVPLFFQLMSINTMKQYSLWNHQYTQQMKQEECDNSFDLVRLNTLRTSPHHQKIYNLPLYLDLDSLTRSLSLSLKLKDQESQQPPFPISFETIKGTLGNFATQNMKHLELLSTISIRNRVAASIHRIEGGGDLWSRPRHMIMKRLYNQHRPIQSYDDLLANQSALPSNQQDVAVNMNYQDPLTNTTKKINQYFYPVPKQLLGLYNLQFSSTSPYSSRNLSPLTSSIEDKDTIDKKDQDYKINKHPDYTYTIKMSRPPRTFTKLQQNALKLKSSNAFDGIDFIDIEDLVKKNAQDKDDNLVILQSRITGQTSTDNVTDQTQQKMQFLSSSVSFCDVFEPYNVMGLVPEYNTSLWPTPLPMYDQPMKTLFPNEDVVIDDMDIKDDRDNNDNSMADDQNQLPGPKEGCEPNRPVNVQCRSCYYTHFCSAMLVAESHPELLLVPVKAFESPSLLVPIKSVNVVSGSEANAVIDQSPTKSVPKDQSYNSPLSNPTWKILTKRLQFVIFYSFLAQIETESYSLYVSNLFGHRQSIFPHYQPQLFSPLSLTIKYPSKKYNPSSPSFLRLLNSRIVTPLQSPLRSTGITPQSSFERSVLPSFSLTRATSIHNQQLSPCSADPSITFSPLSFGSIGSIDGTQVIRNEENNIKMTPVHPVFDLVVTDIEFDNIANKVFYTLVPYNTLYLAYLKYVEQELLEKVIGEADIITNNNATQITKQEIPVPQSTTLGVLNRPLIRPNPNQDQGNSVGLQMGNNSINGNSSVDQSTQVIPLTQDQNTTLASLPQSVQEPPKIKKIHSIYSRPKAAQKLPHQPSGGVPSLSNNTCKIITTSNETPTTTTTTTTNISTPTSNPLPYSIDTILLPHPTVTSSELDSKLSTILSQPQALLYPQLNVREKLDLVQNLIKVASPINLNDYFALDQFTYLSGRYIQADNNSFELDSVGNSSRPKGWYGSCNQLTTTAEIKQDPNDPSSHLLPYRYQSPWSSPWSVSPNLTIQSTSDSFVDNNAIPSSRVYHHNMSQGFIRHLTPQSLTLSVDSTSIEEDPIYIYLTMLQRFQHIKIPSKSKQSTLNQYLNPGYSFQSTRSFINLPYTHWRFTLRVNDSFSGGYLTSPPLGLLIDPVVRDIVRPIGLLQQFFNVLDTNSTSGQQNYTSDKTTQLQLTTLLDNKTSNTIPGTAGDGLGLFYNMDDLLSFATSLYFPTPLPHLITPPNLLQIQSGHNEKNRLSVSQPYLTTTMICCPNGTTIPLNIPPNGVHSYHYESPIEIDVLAMPSIRIKSLLIDNLPPRITHYYNIPQHPHPIISLHGLVNKKTLLSPSSTQTTTSSSKLPSSNTSFYTSKQHPLPPNIIESVQFSLLIRFMVTIGLPFDKLLKIIKYPKVYFLYGFTNPNFGQYLSNPSVYFNGHIPFCKCNSFTEGLSNQEDLMNNDDPFSNQPQLLPQGSVNTTYSMSSTHNPYDESSQDGIQDVPINHHCKLCPCMIKFVLFQFAELMMTMYNIIYCDEFRSTQQATDTCSTLQPKTLSQEEQNCLIMTSISMSHRNMLSLYDFYTKSRYNMNTYRIDLKKTVRSNAGDQYNDQYNDNQGDHKPPLFSLLPILFPYLTSVSTLMITIIYKLNPQQRSAMFVGIKSQDWGSIIGLPGSGKSFIISLLVQLFAGLGQRVLLTSHTNFSVSSLCEKLLNPDVEFKSLDGTFLPPLSLPRVPLVGLGKTRSLTELPIIHHPSSFRPLSLLPTSNPHQQQSHQQLPKVFLTHHDSDPKSLLNLNSNDYRFPMFNLAMVMLRFGQAQVHNHSHIIQTTSTKASSQGIPSEVSQLIPQTDPTDQRDLLSTPTTFKSTHSLGSIDDKLSTPLKSFSEKQHLATPKSIHKNSTPRRNTTLQTLSSKKHLTPGYKSRLAMLEEQQQREHQKFDQLKLNFALQQQYEQHHNGQEESTFASMIDYVDNNNNNVLLTPTISCRTGQNEDSPSKIELKTHSSFELDNIEAADFDFNPFTTKMKEECIFENFETTISSQFDNNDSFVQSHDDLIESNIAQLLHGADDEERVKVQQRIVVSNLKEIDERLTQSSSQVQQPTSSLLSFSQSQREQQLSQFSLDQSQSQSGSQIGEKVLYWLENGSQSDHFSQSQPSGLRDMHSKSHQPQNLNNQLFTLQTDGNDGKVLYTVDGVLPANLLHQALNRYYSSDYYKTNFIQQHQSNHHHLYENEESPRLVTPSLLSHISFILQSHSQIICSTILSLSNGLETLGIFPTNSSIFDVILFEEASQLTIPATLYPLSLLTPTGRFILIGDTNQLPPLVKAGDHLEMVFGSYYSLSNPLLTLLTAEDWRNNNLQPKKNWDNIAIIGSQYRMNEEVCRLSDTLVYNGLLTCANATIAKRRLILPVQKAITQWDKLSGTLLTKIIKSSKVSSLVATFSVQNMSQKKNGELVWLYGVLFEKMMICKCPPVIATSTSSSASSVESTNFLTNHNPAIKRKFQAGSDTDVNLSMTNNDLDQTETVKKQKSTLYQKKSTAQSTSFALLKPPSSQSIMSFTTTKPQQQKTLQWCSRHWLVNCINSPISTIAINTSLLAPFCYDTQQSFPPLSFNANNSILSNGLLNNNNSDSSQQEPESFLHHLLTTLSPGLYNPLEAIIVLQLAAGYLTTGIKAKDIAIITPFKNQQEYIKKVFKSYQNLLKKTLSTLNYFSNNSQSNGSTMDHIQSDESRDDQNLIILSTPQKKIPTKLLSASPHLSLHAQQTDLTQLTTWIQLIIDQLHSVKIYTIDQSQGIDLEIVIISSVISTPQPSSFLSPPPPGINPSISTTITSPNTFSDTSSSIEKVQYPQPWNINTPNYKHLSDWQRGNVALTRAKNKCIIIGDIATLTKGIINPSHSSIDQNVVTTKDTLFHNHALPVDVNTLFKNQKDHQTDLVNYVKTTTGSVYAGAMALLYQDQQTIHTQLDLSTFLLLVGLCLLEQ